MWEGSPGMMAAGSGTMHLTRRAAQDCGQLGERPGTDPAPQTSEEHSLANNTSTLDF